MTQGIRIRAYGKINPVLKVGPVRSDGFHEVRMLLQSVSVFDELQLCREEGTSSSLECGDPSVPPGENNLILRAARLLEKTYEAPPVRVTLHKKIPVSAGMAGGSADAAAVLWAMNHLFRLGLTKDELSRAGACLGSDIPFCLKGGLCLAEGRGEKVTAYPSLQGIWLVILKPPYSISTAQAYRETPAALGNAEQASTENYDVVTQMCSLAGEYAGRVPDRFFAVMENDLELSGRRHHPDLRDRENRMIEMGAVGAMMSGSGPSVFGVFRSPDLAQQCGRKLQKEFPSDRVLITSPVPAGLALEKGTGEYAFCTGSGN